MSLGVNSVTLLTLTARKADCELDISLDAAEKMALTRQQSQLSQEYYARLQGKNIAYYANGQYCPMDLITLWVIQDLLRLIFYLVILQE